MSSRRLPPAAAAAAAIAILAQAPPAGVPAEEPARTGAVEREEVHVVLIDAVVTGPDGRPVSGLTLADFALKVDGKNAAVSALEDRCPAAPPGSGEAPAPAPSPAAEGAPAPAAAPPAERRAEPARVVLYFDLPHLSPPGSARSVRAARRILESEAAAGARFMVVAYGPDVRLLAPLTSDRGALSAALEEVLEGPVLYDEGPFARTARIQEVTHETCPQTGPANLAPSLQPPCPNQLMRATDLARQAEARARKSLAALKEVMVSLSGAPGRKAVVFFSETLQDEPGVEYLEIARTTPRGQLIDITLSLKEVVEEANAASISFYTVHAAGLQDPSEGELYRSVSSVGTAGEFAQAPTRVPRPPTPRPRFGKGQMEADIGPLARAERTAEAAAVGFSTSLAAETGGRHLARTNDLSAIIPLVAEDMGCYYVLAYRAPSAADGRRHSLVVTALREGLRVRARPFYVDWSPAERVERRMRTALAAPGAFRDLETRVEGFSMGRSRGRSRVLVKVSVPVAGLLRSAEGIPPGDGGAEVKIAGRVADERTERCAFGKEIAVLPAEAASRSAGLLHYETICDLPPGPHEISAAVLEKRGGALGAVRAGLAIPALAGFHVGEAQLWAASGSDLLNREDAAAVLGPSRGNQPGAPAPRTERRLVVGEKGSLFFLICPAADAKGAPGPLLPVTVTRALLSGEDPVATLPPLRFDALPEDRSGCWGVATALPVESLGEGLYTFDYEVHSAALGEPVRRRTVLAVEPPGGVRATSREGARPAS